MTVCKPFADHRCLYRDYIHVVSCNSPLRASRMKFIKKCGVTAVTAAFTMMYAPISAYATDMFNPATSLLTIDKIQVNGLGAYKNVKAALHSFTLLRVDNGVAQANTFYPQTNLLFLGVVAYEGSTCNNVHVKVNSYSLLGTALSKSGPGRSRLVSGPVGSGESSGF